MSVTLIHSSRVIISSLILDPVWGPTFDQTQTPSLGPQMATQSKTCVLINKRKKEFQQFRVAPPPPPRNRSPDWASFGIQLGVQLLIKIRPLGPQMAAQNKKCILIYRRNFNSFMLSRRPPPTGVPTEPHLGSSLASKF